MKAGLAFTGRTHVSTLYESIYHDCGIDDAEADEHPRRHTVDKAWSGMVWLGARSVTNYHSI